MGNSLNSCCNSRQLIHNEEVFSLFEVCLSILKKIIGSYILEKTNINFVDLESSYLFLSNLFQKISYTPILNKETHKKLKEYLSQISNLLITHIDDVNRFFESVNFEKMINEIKIIDKHIVSKDFKDLNIKRFDEYFAQTYLFSQNNIEIIKDFSTINGAKFWFENFNSLLEVEWKKFYKVFKVHLELNYYYQISLDIVLTIKDNLDLNHNLKVNRSDWNNFYFQTFSDWSEMRKLFQNTTFGSFYLKNTLSLIYKLNPNEENMENFYFKTPTRFIISDEGLISPKEFKVEKNLNEEGLTFGRNNNSEEVDVSFHKNLKEISKNHFQIINNYVKNYCGFLSEFYLINLSVDSPILFIVEEKKGYALYENSLISLNNDVKILIKSIWPSSSKLQFNENYYYIEPNCGNKLEMNNPNKKRNPLIILQFLNENKEYKFEVFHETSDFQITIGNSFKNDITLSKTDPDHCIIQYNHQDNIWFIVDGFSSQRTNKYRTFLFPFDKGVKLVDKMKLWLNGHIFEIEENS